MQDARSPGVFCQEFSAKFEDSVVSKGNTLSRWCIITLTILVSFVFHGAVTAAEYGANTSAEGMEILTRGPIHEAFAEVSVDEAKPEMVISRSVPDPINEIPPDYRPEGNNVQWIPGYWSWDDDQNDFIWVSGVWRDLPPGRQWVPGSWVTVAGGNQYVSGYWTEPRQAETVYLPPPPEPPPTAPGVPSYASDTIWVDGHWLWAHNGYVWQAGYWLRQRPEMAWIPAHYVWTPRGYIFVPGYWDYQLVRRGVMFAPRYYSRPIYRNHDYYYTPSIIIDIDAIFLSLFIRPHHHHYYFGDYHDVRYERRGYLPWYSKHATRHGYDPYYRSYRWHQSRHDDRWEHKYRQQYAYRREHREARPPVFYRSKDRNEFVRQQGEKKQTLGRPFARDDQKDDSTMHYTRSRPDDKKDYRQNREAAAPQDTRSQSKKDKWRTVNDQSRIDQQRQEPSSRVRQREISSQSDQPRRIEAQGDRPRRIEAQSDRPRRIEAQGDRPRRFEAKSDQPRRIEPKNENRTVRQSSKNQERRQLIIDAGQKSSERQARQEKGIASSRVEEKSEPARVKNKRKFPVDPEAQVEGNGTAIQADGQIIKRPLPETSGGNR